MNRAAATAVICWANANATVCTTARSVNFATNVSRTATVAPKEFAWTFRQLLRLEDSATVNWDGSDPDVTSVSATKDHRKIGQVIDLFAGSPVKSTEIDFELYTEKKLSDTFTLYWRILKDHRELEAVLVVNGTSYAALGWRPRGLTKSCKNFPQIGPVALAEPPGKSHLPVSHFRQD